MCVCVCQKCVFNNVVCQGFLCNWTNQFLLDNLIEGDCVLFVIVTPINFELVQLFVVTNVTGIKLIFEA